MMRRAVLLALASRTLASDEVSAPQPLTSLPGAAFFEPFDSTWGERWTVSRSADFPGTWKHQTYEPDTISGDKGLEVEDVL